jgi:hypothetical protein
MGQVALGQLQGQYEAQQMQQRDQQQAFQQGLQLFGTRHGLEQEQRQERLGAIREAGSHARDIIPEQRGGFLSDIDTRTAAELDRPYQTGLSQFDDLIRSFNGRLPVGTGFTPPAGAQALPPLSAAAGGVPSAVSGATAGGGAVLPGGYQVAQENLTQGNQPGSQAVAGALQGGYQQGGVTSGGPATGQPGFAPGQPYFPQPPVLGPPDPQQLAQAAIAEALAGQTAGPFAQALAPLTKMMRHLPLAVAGVTGASGSNNAGIVPGKIGPIRSAAAAPPIGGGTTSLTGPAPAGGGAFDAAASLGVPTAPAPPGATGGGTAPVTVAPGSVYYPLGGGRGYQLGEVSPQQVTQAENNFQATLRELNNSQLNPQEKQYLNRLALNRPSPIHTAADLAALQQLTVLIAGSIAGRGAAQTNAQARLLLADRRQQQASVGAYLKAISQVQNPSPDDKKGLALQLGFDEDTANQLSGLTAVSAQTNGLVRNLLHEITTKDFSVAPLEYRQGVLDILGAASRQLGIDLEGKLPANFERELTPYERAQINLGRGRLKVSQDLLKETQARTHIERERLNNKERAAGTGLKGQLTAGQWLSGLKLAVDKTATAVASFYRQLIHTGVQDEYLNALEAYRKNPIDANNPIYSKDDNTRHAAELEEQHRQAVTDYESALDQLIAQRSAAATSPAATAPGGAGAHPPAAPAPGTHGWINKPSFTVVSGGARQSLSKARAETIIAAYMRQRGVSREQAIQQFERHFVPQ